MHGVKNSARYWSLAGVALAFACLLAPTHESEVARLQSHFSIVEAELLAASVAELTPRQRDARARHIEVLRQYSDRGVFPHNHDFADRVPYFVDRHGTHCALAYLIKQSGRSDLVAAVSRTRNNAYVHELADDERLLAWLDDAGLSAAEAAHIQPTYDCEFYGDCPDEDVSQKYAAATVAANVLNGISIGVNVHAAGSKWRGGLAIATGVAEMYLGSTKLTSEGTAGLLGKLNLGVGIVAVVMGVRTIASRPTPSKPTAGPPGKYSVAPILTDTGAGVAVIGRF